MAPRLEGIAPSVSPGLRGVASAPNFPLGESLLSPNTRSKVVVKRLHSVPTTAAEAFDEALDRVCSLVSMAPPFFEEDCITVSTFDASISVTNMFLGFMTVMSVPFLFKTAGLVAFLGLLGANVLCFTTAYMLGLVLENQRNEGEDFPTFDSIACAAFGPTFRRVMQVIGVFDVIMYVVVLYVMIGIHVPLCIPGATDWQALLAAAILASFLDHAPRHIYKLISSVAVLLVLLACALVIATGMDLPTFAGPPPLARQSIVGPAFQAFAVGFYGSGFHIYYPGIFNKVESRSSFNWSILMGSAVFVALTTAFGIATCWIFGEATQTLATENVAHDATLPNPQPIPGCMWMLNVVCSLTALKNFFTLKDATPPLTQLTSTILSFYTGVGESSLVMQRTCGLVSNLAPASMALFLTNAVIEIESFVGLVIYSVICVLFPLAVCLKILHLSIVTKGMCSLGVLVGVLMLGKGVLDVVAAAD